MKITLRAIEGFKESQQIRESLNTKSQNSQKKQLKSKNMVQFWEDMVEIARYHSQHKN